MKDTAILCFIKYYGTEETIYTRFIRKVPRVGEFITIVDKWLVKVVNIVYMLEEEDESQIVYINVERIKL